MKLLFSEARPDYGHYIFPYVVWAFPDVGETPADFFTCGFLPSSRNLDRFYLCRQVRVALHAYQPSSENRRILRKGEGIQAALIPRAEFDYTPQRRDSYRAYADARFGREVMSEERLDSLFQCRITSHLLVFTDTRSGSEVGAVTLYLEPPGLAYYYNAFYDLAGLGRNMGMFMMTSAVALFAARGFTHLHLGSCYHRKALYKTQFAGCEFFNGVRWSKDLEELKYLIDRGDAEQTCHLLEDAGYRESYYDCQLPDMAERFGIKVSARNANSSEH